MKYILNILLLFIVLPAAAQDRIATVLDDLDRVIDDAYIYRVEKDRRIVALKFKFSESEDPTQGANLSHEIFEEYKTYQYDSAYLYALQMRDLAVESDNIDLIAQSQSALLYCYAAAGFFKEGGDIIENFSAKGVDKNIVVNYYKECIRYYYNLMRYVANIEQLSTQYRDEIHRYTDLTLEQLPTDSFEYRYIDAQNSFIFQLDPYKGIEDVQNLLLAPNISLHTKAILYSWLGLAYEIAGDRDAAIYYTALSAIADVESCTFETTSAKVLAEYMYENNRIERAARYIKLAMQDANTYNSPYRKLEVQTIMPDIADQRLYNVEQDKRFITIISVIIGLLLLVIIIALCNIHKRNVALCRARAEIEKNASKLLAVNDRLESVNSELCEANKIKDRYIIESLYSDSSFVDSVEKNSKALIRRIKAQQYSGLVELINGVNIKQERQRMSSTFDAAFLKLFPNFVEEYNKLFAQDQAVSLNASGELPAEVRIFALIRLGIEDVNQIARYLNLSLNTVYVYKAKVKARSIVPKEEFEERIKAISQSY